MKYKEFESRMYSEWKKNTLDRYSNCLEYPYFDLVWDLRDNLYDIFYPLGISGGGIHDVVRVVDEICYAFEDDGELSIVANYTEDPSFFQSFEKVYKLIGKEPIKPKPTFDYFVCKGDSHEINSDSQYYLDVITGHALTHIRTNVLVSYKAKCFNLDVLKFLHGLIPRFEKEKELAKINDKSYFSFRTETKQIVENFIIRE